MIKLRDKTFLITGGTTDIGRSLCVLLASMGADIAILDKNPEKARRIVDEISDLREVRETHGKAAYFEVDITKPAALREAVSQTAETFGAIDVMVAGLATNTVVSVSAPDYFEQLDRMVDVNLKSCIYATHMVLPYMRNRKRGKIIYLVPDLVRWGFEEESLLAASRGGLIYYAKSLARELSKFNIAVNCVASGPTEDYLLTRDPKVSTIKQAEEKLAQVMPMGRLMRPDEIAQVIAFLSSSSSDAVTGQTWAVNGGLTMM